MSMEYVRKMYGVPAMRGGRICFHGMGGDKYGTILSASQHLRVRMDDGSRLIFHPTWRIEYLPYVHLEPKEANPCQP